MAPKTLFAACLCYSLALAGQLQPTASRNLGKRQALQQPVFANPDQIAADDSELFDPYWKFVGNGQVEWRGKDPEWFSTTTSTETIDDQPTEVPEPVGVQAAKNTDSGDVDIAVSPAVLDKIKDIFKNAPKCGGARRRLRSRADACGFQAASQTIAEDAELSSALQQFPGILAEAMGEAGEQFAFTTAKELAALGVDVELMEMTVTGLGGIAGIGILVGLWRMFDNALDVVPILGVPEDQVIKVGAPDNDKNPENGNDDNGDESKTCPAQGDYNEYPACELDECKAENGKCTTEDFKDCVCIPEGGAHEEASFPDVNALLAELSDPNPASVNEPECNTDRRQTYNIGSFEYMASYFCANHAFRGNQETVEVDVSGNPYAEDQDSPHVKWSWSSDKDDCTIDCISMVQRLAEDCGSDDGFGQSGKVTDGCGEVSYEIMLPEEEPQDDSEPEPEPEPEEPEFEAKITCGGSSLCGGPLLKKKQCDHAVNYLRRDRENPFTYSTADNTLNGNCWADIAGNGCGVFLEGDGCEMIGDDMWEAFQDIRQECNKCGKKEYAPGCFMKIDYVTGCDNRG